MAIEFGDRDTPAHHLTTFTCDDRGRHLVTASVSPDGGEHIDARSSYAEDGRRVQVTSFGPSTQHVDGYGIEGGEGGYPAPGAVRMTTRYDLHGRAEEVIFENAAGEVVQHVRMTRDEAGRLLVEEANMPGLAPPAMESLPDEERRALASLLTVAAGTIRTTSVYDGGGRRIRQSREMGALSEETATFRYDISGFLVEESRRTTSREYALDEAGAPRQGADITRQHDSRYAYVFDAAGNWIERVINSRLSPGGDFAVVATERRTIDYWD